MRSDKIVFSEDKLIDLYSRLGSLNKMALELGCSAKTVKRRMSELGVEYAPRTSYDCDEGFFSIDRRNRLQYYWAGFIAADGGIDSRKGSYTLKIELSSKDRHHIEAFKKDVKSTAPIRDHIIRKNDVRYLKKEYGVSLIRVGSKRLVTDLERFNVFPRKTYTYSFPKFLIDDELVNSFILGLIDGDGWFGQSKGTLRLGFCGRRDVVSDVHSIINDQCGLVSGGTIYDEGGITKLEIGGNDQLKYVVDWLYTGTPRYLARKRDKALATLYPTH
jgi:hypothetical protein